MTVNILSVIASMAEAATVTPHELSIHHPKMPVVTISRDYGSGGDVIATRLSQRLGVPLYDDSVITDVAARLHEDPVTMRLLDEEFGRVKDMWLYRLVSGSNLGVDVYRDTLIKVVMNLGRLGGVIIGRGAHVVLADACALRVRVVGSPEICARRMERGGHGAYESELEHAHTANKRRSKFVWDLFQARLADANQFDLIVNTDRMDDFEDAVEMLVHMAQAIHHGRVLTSAQP